MFLISQDAAENLRLSDPAPAEPDDKPAMSAPAASDKVQKQIDPSLQKKDDPATAASPGDDAGGGNRSDSPVSDCNTSDTNFCANLGCCLLCGKESSKNYNVLN